MDKTHILSLSGGKDSTALAIHMDQNYPSIDMNYVFCDTGRELPSLYDFLEKLDDVVDNDIVWLNGGWHCKECDEYGPDPITNKCPECGGEVKERDFDYYMNRWSNAEDGMFMPSGESRWCTRHLKRLPFKRYLRKYVESEEIVCYLGFRADEDRTASLDLDTDKQVKYKFPLREDGIDLNGVVSILDDYGLDMPEYYNWRSTGGCANCPLQRISDWKNLSRKHPELFEKYKEEEEKGQFTWNATKSLEAIQQQREIFDIDDEREEVWQGPDCGSSFCGK